MAQNICICTLKLALILILVGVVIPHGWAESSLPQLKLQYEDQKIKVDAVGLSLSQKQIKWLQNELNEHEEIYNWFNQNPEKVIQLDQESLEMSRQGIEQAQKATAQVLKQNLILLFQKDHQVESGLEDLGWDWEKGSRRVIVGGHLVVPSHAYYSELMVIGGQVEIYGNIKKLVLIGSEAYIFASAKVEDELVSVGSLVRNSQFLGSQKKQFDISVPLNEQQWNRLLSRIEDEGFLDFITSGWSKLTIIFLKLLIILLIFFVADYVAPNFMDKCHHQLESKWWLSFMMAASSLLFVLPLTVLLTISLIGIPLLPLQFSLLFIFIVIGYGLVGRVTVERWAWIKQKSPWIGLTLGVLLLEALSFIPYLGNVLRIMLICVGFGGVSKVFYQTVLTPNKRAGVKNV